MFAMQLIVGIAAWRCVLLLTNCIPQQPMVSELYIACAFNSSLTEQGMSPADVALCGGTTLTYCLPAEQSTTAADTSFIGQLCGLL